MPSGELAPLLLYRFLKRAFRAAQADDKVKAAAESYLKFLEAQRALRGQPVQTASNG